MTLGQHSKANGNVWHCIMCVFCDSNTQRSNHVLRCIYERTCREIQYTYSTLAKDISYLFLNPPNYLTISEKYSCLKATVDDISCIFR